MLRSHTKLSDLIASRLGPEAGGLLAQPVYDGASHPMGWVSRHGGELRPAAASPSADAIRAAYQATAARIEGLATELDAQGEAGQVAAHSLRSALVTPDGVDSLYADGDRPVLVRWGMAAPGQAVPELAIAAPVVAPEASALAGAAAGGMMAGGTAAGGALSWRAALWLVPLGLAGLSGWLAWEVSQPLPVETVVTVPPAPPAPDPTLGLTERIAALEAAATAATDLDRRLARMCVAVAPPAPTGPAAFPLPDPSEQLPEDKTEEAAPEPPEAPQPPQDEPQRAEEAPTSEEPPQEPEVAELRVYDVPTGRPPVPSNLRRQRPRQVLNIPSPQRSQPARPAPAPPIQTQPQAQTRGTPCNPIWPSGRSPRVLFVVDGSGSMRDRISGAPSRLSAAKSSISRTVRSLHKDIRIGTVSFSDCGATRHSKFYSSAERGALLGRVNAMRPGRATSLAASIRRAGAAAPRRAESVIVVLSDGEDTCGGNPCAAAREVVARKPNIRINVIDLSGGRSSRELRCVAQSGGGRVYQPNTASEMAQQIQRATGQPDASRCG